MAKLKPITDREIKADYVYEVLAEQFPGESIDSVMTRPFDFARVLLETLRCNRKLAGGQVRHVRQLIEAIELEGAAAVQAMNDFARATLSSRKRGGRKVKKGSR